jgi:hypothetical protein
MMEKSAQDGESGGGARPPPFTLFTITYKVAVYALGTLTLFYLYPFVLYSVDWTSSAAIDQSAEVVNTH